MGDTSLSAGRFLARLLVMAMVLAGSVLAVPRSAAAQGTPVSPVTTTVYSCPSGSSVVPGTGGAMLECQQLQDGFEERPPEVQFVGDPPVPIFFCASGFSFGVNAAGVAATVNARHLSHLTSPNGSVGNEQLCRE